MSINLEWCHLRIQALEEHKIKQIDENRKISRMLDELQTDKITINYLNSEINRINQSLINICTNIDKLVKNSIEDVNNKIDEISKLLED